MNFLRPFFLLIQRPMVLFGAVGWMIIATFLVGGLVTSGGDSDTYMDAALMTVIVLSVYTGWIAGACVLELQQASFTFTLPGSQIGLVPGFLLLGTMCVALAVALVTGNSPYPQNATLLFLAGMGSFALGGAIRDPKSAFMTGLGLALFLVLVVTSGTLGVMAAKRPIVVGAAATALLLIGVYRLFARAAFRNRSIDAQSLVLAFSLRKLAAVDKNRRLSRGPGKTRWTRGYLGQDTSNWVRAAWHETYGFVNARSIPGYLTRSWGLFLVLLLAGREERNEIGFWKSLCWSLHDAIMRSPHSPEYGEKGGPFLLIAIIILIIGATLATFRPVSLGRRMLYPLSRPQKCRVLFIGSLADLGILAFLVSPFLFLLGHATGWAAGIESRFDYLPYFVRPLFVTMLLMPFAYWGRLQILKNTRSQEGHSIMSVILMQTAFVIAGLFLVFLSGWAFESGGIELLVLSVGLFLSRLLYRRRLQTWYSKEDLC